MGLLEKISRSLSNMLLWVAGAFLIAMILMTCANIITRLLGTPIKGTFELMGYFGAVATAFALGHTQIRKAHISVDILVNRFSPRTRRMLNGINHVICFLFFGTAGWQVARWAATLRETGEVTETLRIIYYPFTYGVAVGCFLIALVLLVDFLKVLSARNGAS
jgi:TRAP-type C4-dicarboxylate transport system permease small subunit